MKLQTLLLRWELEKKLVYYFPILMMGDSMYQINKREYLEMPRSREFKNYRKSIFQRFLELVNLYKAIKFGSLELWLW